MSASVQDFCDFLESFAPTSLAEDWDNVGLLVGDFTRPVERVMTCLTITPKSAQEAIERDVDLVVSHHPMPFQATKRITNESTVGRILLQLIENKVAVYSPHTSFDSAGLGINQQLADCLGLQDVRPLQPLPDQPELGSGRHGRCQPAVSAGEIASRLKTALEMERGRLVGSPQDEIRQVGLACGAAGEFLPAARRQGCQMLVTGETNFHTCLEAEATGMVLLLTGHYASERFAVESLAHVLSEQFQSLEIWPSAREANPWRWV